MNAPLDRALRELALRSQLEPTPSLGDLAPLSQVVLLTEALVWIANKGDEGVRVLAAREMLAAALRLDPDVRLGLDA